jgi:hypothetical protein
MGSDIGLQDVLHPRKMSLSLTFEKLENIRIKFQVNRSRLFRLNKTGISPKIRCQFLTLQGLGIAGEFSFTVHFLQQQRNIRPQPYPMKWLFP